MTHRDTLEPVDGAGARKCGRHPVGHTRRGALHEHRVAVGQLHNARQTMVLITSARTGPVVQFWIWWFPRDPVGHATMSPDRTFDTRRGRP